MKIRHLSAVVTTVAAAATLAIVPGSASAVKPVVTPPAGDYRITIPAALTPCGSLTVDVHDGERYTTFFNKDGSVRVIGVNGTFTMHVQSNGGGSIDLNVSGPGRLFPNGDIVLTGAILLFAPHTLALVHGRALIPGGADPDSAQITGSRVDLCPILFG